MHPEIEFRADLYRGTAPYYDRYRPPYPEALLEHLLGRTALRRRLLDLACGTGQIAVPLASRFDSVVAVDQEPESVEFGRRKCVELGVDNITWVAGSAETVELEGCFDLITVGNAFQRLRRSATASRMRDWLVPGGSVALVWGDMPWVGELDWQKTLLQLFVDWVERLDVAQRVPAGFVEAMQEEPHELVLRRAGFDYAGRYEFTVQRTWALEELAGYMYSTSLLNRATFGGRAAEFEDDLSEQLLELQPSGRFEGPTSYAYELAVAPTR